MLHGLWASRCVGVGGDVALSGFSRRVLCWGEGRGLVMGLGVGEWVRSFAGDCCRRWWGKRCFCVGGWLCVLLAACMMSSLGTLGWFGEDMYEVSYVCV